MISPRLQQRDSLLFVYGTLRRFCGAPMALRLRQHALRRADVMRRVASLVAERRLQ